MSKNNAVWISNPIFYTALYRKKGSRKFYLCGYRSIDLESLQSMVYSDVRNGICAVARIIRQDTGDVIEEVM